MDERRRTDSSARAHGKAGYGWTHAVSRHSRDVTFTSAARSCEATWQASFSACPIPRQQSTSTPRSKARPAARGPARMDTGSLGLFGPAQDVILGRGDDGDDLIDEILVDLQVLQRGDEILGNGIEVRLREAHAFVRLAHVLAGPR